MAAVVPWHAFHWLAQAWSVTYSKMGKTQKFQFFCTPNPYSCGVQQNPHPIHNVSTRKSFLHTWVRHFSKSFRTNQWKTHNHHTLHLPPTQDAIITTRMTWNILESGIPTTKPLFPTNCIPGTRGTRGGVDTNHTFFLDRRLLPKESSRISSHWWGLELEIPSPPQKKKSANIRAKKTQKILSPHPSFFCR